MYTVEYKSKGYIFEGRLEAMEFIARILKEAENKLVENTMIVKEIIALEITKVIRSECNHAVNR